MKSLKKRSLIFVTALLMVAGTVLPAAAQDNPAPTPSAQTITVTVNVGGLVFNLSIPVRCGNSC